MRAIVEIFDGNVVTFMSPNEEVLEAVYDSMVEIEKGSFDGDCSTIDENYGDMLFVPSSESVTFLEDIAA